ncbi:uncharacterized protein TNCV_95231 [Trichonephila clavipes]|nr:uncharacterized protein TNCV_95231 [Trichonephila clavipes]
MVMSETHSEKRKFEKAGESSVNKKARREVSKTWGVEALHHSVKGKYSKKDVKHWLSQKDAYTLHKPVRHKFQRNRVFVSDIDRQFQADLVDMQSLAEFNKGYKYLLTCIDLFSKFAWAVPLKDKFGKSVKSGLEIIFKERKPKVLQTDAAGDGNISSTVKRTIDVGCYETMLDIISAVQLALPKNPNRFTIIYNKATKRVKINAVQGSSLHLENLGELLGFKRNAIIIGKDGETISQYYDRPQYLPLVRHSFQTIQSELRLNSGDFVPFERGENNTTQQQERTTQLGSRNETTQLVSRNETTQLNSSKQLNSSVGTKQLNSALPSTAYNRLQPPANRLQPPATACNRLQTACTACTAFTAESAFSTYSRDTIFWRAAD